MFLVAKQKVWKIQRHYIPAFGKSQHSLVELQQIVVLQLTVLYQMPQPSCITVAPIVALSRKVYPIGVSKLVAHKVEVGLSARQNGKEAYHLVQRHSPIHVNGMRRLFHRVVHGLVHKSEGNGFVAHYGLVVAFAIGHRFHIPYPVVHHIPQPIHIPLLVSAIGQQLYPIVGYCHSHTVVESYAAVGYGYGNAGHTAHLFGNGGRGRVYGVYKVVGKGKIGNGSLVGLRAEIVVVGAKVVDIAMMMIYHRGYAVESEAVDVILFHPITNVREQETLHLGFRIVE